MAAAGRKDYVDDKHVDRGLREPREAESWKSVDQKGGPAACSNGMACEALGRPKKGDRQATRTAALTAGLLA